jgi:hypothetical protein
MAAGIAIVLIFRRPLYFRNELGSSMNLSPIDSVIFAIPVFSLLALFVFRLDVVLFRTTAKQAAGRSHRRRFANFESSATLMTDPDGRVSQPTRAPRRPLMRDSAVSASRAKQPQ